MLLYEVGQLMYVVTGLPLFWTGCRKRNVSIADLSRLMSSHTATHASIQKRVGVISPGLQGDLVVWNPDASFTVCICRRFRYETTPDTAWLCLTCRGIEVDSSAVTRLQCGVTGEVNHLWHRQGRVGIESILCGGRGGLGIRRKGCTDGACFEFSDFVGSYSNEARGVYESCYSTRVGMLSNCKNELPAHQRQLYIW